MESTEAYDLYWNLPPATTPALIAIIRALGNQAWKMRQEEDKGKAKPSYLPMPEPLPVAIATPPAPKPVAQPKPKPAAPKEEDRGGSLFFLKALKS